jgi:hypothetical protein
VRNLKLVGFEQEPEPPSPDLLEVVLIVVVFLILGVACWIGIPPEAR